MRWSTLLFLLPASAFGQALQPTLLSTLPQALDEVSGMVMVDGAAWVVLDSFNPAVLHQVDPATGAIVRSLTITGAANVDWEELTTDGEYVYIGDIGNNLGMRTDLRILRFPLAVLQDEDATSTPVETIAFAYADQTDFTPALDGSNWDCEAMVALDDSLFLFTKNWVDQRSHLYVLPAQPGTHLAVRRDTLNAQGLITGAASLPDGSSIALIGHTMGVEPFIWQLSAFPGHDLCGGAAERRMLDMPPEQTEGIAWAATDTVLISNERGNSGPARLWRLHLDLFDGIAERSIRRVALFHPDPATDELTIAGAPERAHLRILDSEGRTVLQGSVINGDPVDVHMLPAGPYVLQLSTGGTVVRDRLVIAR
ncbi:MAG TPA: T9SS type A sorting domain-containing protein [Flavobacteriales bacterium]